MRVLLLADVHANWPALQAAVSDAGQVDYIIHAGDSIGYYPYPEECVSWLRDKVNVNVMGNHDYALVSGDYRGFSNEAYSVLSWTDQHLSARNLKYLSNLKDTWSGDVGGVMFGVVHGGLSDPHNEFMHAGSSESLINSYFDKLGVKVLVGGHVHQMFVRQYSKGLLINPGSIGQPRDNNPNPSYILLEVNGGRVETVMPKRFSYDVDAVVSRMNAEMLPRVFTERLKRGY